MNNFVAKFCDASCGVPTGPNSLFSFEGQLCSFA